MAALWTLGAVGIYVDGFEFQRRGNWAEIDILDASDTTLHYYGATSARYRMRGHLWGTSNVETLKGYIAGGTTRTLTGPNALSKDFKVMDVTARRRPDKTDTSNELWQVELELIRP